MRLGKKQGDGGLEVPAGAPTGLKSVVNADGSVVFSWTAGPNGTVPTVRYDLDFSLEGGSGLQVSTQGAVTSITVKSLPSRASISWTVRAASADGLGAKSAPGSFFIGKPLAVPTIDEAYYDGSAVVLDFSGAEPDALYVQVVTRVTGSQTVLSRTPMLIQDGTLVRVTGLTWGTSYDFTLRSMLNATQLSAESAARTVVYGSGVPAAPVISSVNESPLGTVTVSWAKPVQWVDSYSFGWKKATAADFAWSDGLDKSLLGRILAGLDPDTAYVFAVKAVNRYGTSPAGTRNYTTNAVAPTPGPTPGPGGYLNILGHYNIAADLRAAKPSGKLGDLYLVGDGLLFAWDGSAWVESGQVTGQKGDVGPAGPAGPAGAAGKDGAAGPKGDAGAPGKDGVKGDQGIPGPQGVAGPAGAQGSDGPQGPQGPIGLPGPAGKDSTVPGPKGDTGPQGPAGPKGADSTVPGPKGDVGPAGPAGKDGVQGPKGDAGATGVISGTLPVLYEPVSRNVALDMAYLDDRYAGGGTGSLNRTVKNIGWMDATALYQPVVGDERVILVLGATSRNGIYLDAPSLQSLPAGSELWIMQVKRPWVLEIKSIDNTVIAPNGRFSIADSDLIKLLKITNGYQPGVPGWIITSGDMQDTLPFGPTCIIAEGAKVDSGITVKIQNTEPNKDCSGYTISYSEVGGYGKQVVVDDPTLTEYVITGLKNGTRYGVIVEANGFGTKGPYSSFDAVAGVDTPSGRPAITGFTGASGFNAGELEFITNGTEGQMVILEINDQIDTTMWVPVSKVLLPNWVKWESQLKLRIGVGYTPEDMKWSSPVFATVSKPLGKPSAGEVVSTTLLGDSADSVVVKARPGTMSDNLTRFSLVYKPIGSIDGKVISFDEFKSGDTEFTFTLTDLDPKTVYQCYLQSANARGYTNSDFFTINSTALMITGVTAGAFGGTEIRVQLPTPAPTALYARMRLVGGEWKINPEQRSIYGDVPTVTFAWKDTLPFYAPNRMEIQVSVDGKEWSSTFAFDAPVIGMIELDQVAGMAFGVRWHQSGQTTTGCTYVDTWITATDQRTGMQKAIPAVDYPEYGTQYKKAEGLDGFTDYAMKALSRWKNNVTGEVYFSRETGNYYFTTTRDEIMPTPSTITVKPDPSSGQYYAALTFTVVKHATYGTGKWLVNCTLDGVKLQPTMELPDVGIEDLNVYEIKIDAKKSGTLRVEVFGTNYAGATPVVSDTCVIPVAPAVTRIESLTSTAKGTVEIKVADDTNCDGLMVSLMDSGNYQHSELAKKVGDNTYDVAGLKAGTWTVSASLEKNGGTTDWTDEQKVTVK